MDDLISRRAAIDAAIEAVDSWDGVCNIGRQKRIENYINSLPFAPGMDLISRRAAIDICANVIDLFRGQFGAGVLVAIKESIEELPSALSTNLAEVGTDSISRQQAIDAINEYMAGKRCDTDGTMMARLINELVIKKLPSAQPKMGKWIYHIDDLFPAESTMECNQCHAEQPLTCDDEFCPHCGAKMEVME